MRRKVQIVLLCEDTQHETFVRRYLNAVGWPDYPRLRKPRQCQQHVDTLADMCRGDGLRAPAPPSLEAACAEYRRLLGNG